MLKIDKIELPDFPLLLAPMEDVSDPPFRRLCKMHGADLMYSEFISSEGLIRDAIKSKKKLDIFDYERPIGIQIFGGDADDAVNGTFLDGDDFAFELISCTEFHVFSSLILSYTIQYNIKSLQRSS